jgi:hypothetical protein
MKPVNRGDEITVSYIQSHNSKEKRALDLSFYGFVCDCRACTEDIENPRTFAYHSAKRRMRIQELNDFIEPMQRRLSWLESAHNVTFLPALRELATLHLHEGNISPVLAKL